MLILEVNKKREHRRLVPTMLPNIHINRSYMNTNSKVANIPNWQNTSLKDLTGEVWMPIHGYEGRYEVSNMGRVKSLRRKINNYYSKNRYTKEIIIKPHFWGKYLRVNLYIDGAKKKYSIHRLVMESFSPPIDGKDFINHINAITKDNRLANLEWCTSKENIVHAFKLNLRDTAKGERQGSSKLKRHDVISIKNRLKKGEEPVNISADYQVSSSTIQKIKEGKNWKHIVI